MPPNQQQQVKTFFDTLAPRYPRRFQEAEPFHRYLFTERLAAAVAGLDLRGRAILDVGAGTGPLYDYVLEQGNPELYQACDLSAAMLAQSRIPAAQQRVGDLLALHYPDEAFDLVFMLGVTTYISKKEWPPYFNHCRPWLHPAGRLIMSFTNRQSLDFRLRKLVRPFFRWLRPGRDLISQPFTAAATTPEELPAHLPPGWIVEEVRWLTPSLPFLRMVSNRLALRFATWAGRHFPNSRRLCTDFLIILTPASGDS